MSIFIEALLITCAIILPFITYAYGFESGKNEVLEKDNERLEKVIKNIDDKLE